ncbi:autotransporter outer membrane beta-barrel domain-containing protein [Hyphobacterium marinum]|uniref:Autotransporter domain-containing protein n=1 Tax=Hyphobacterium marinum TaxID=3116574 RepID=A0ABU7M221_9PROT|nr:autotransporter domain-containing protein [Hyphobacterium sp. Y6023]MEE2567587.1 autotransporter domain-containing protein [Hyphobacterium sp. Y6023]
MRKSLLLSSALSAALLGAPLAFGDTEVTDERTDPIRTSTLGDNGDNLIITNTGRVTLADTDPGPAVIVDGNHTVDNRGNISVIGADGGVGIQVNDGVTGGVTNSGQINVSSTDGPTDEDGDGDLDGPTAFGSNRVAILIDPGTFTGDIVNTGSGVITVIGNQSAGIRAMGLVDGNIENAGQIGITGDYSYGIDIRGGLTGDLTHNGRITANGVDSVGIRVGSAIDGMFFVGGTVDTSAYRVSFRPTVIGARFIDEDDIRLSGSAIQIGASLGGGFYSQGFSSANGQTITQGATINARTTAPAIWISPEFATGTAGNIVLGLVTLPADPDDEDSTEEAFQFSFVNRGTVTGSGFLDGNTSTGLRIEGAMVDNVFYTTTLEGGLYNLGTIAAESFSANATAVLLGNGAIIPVIRNDLQIRAIMNGTNGDARAIVILAGANTPILRNNSVIIATANGRGGAYGIIDQSNTLGTIENTGFITALLRDENGGALDPTTDDGSDSPEEMIERTAIDVRNSTIDVTYRQMLADGVEDDSQTGVRGDIRMGSGDDTIDASAGIIDGDLYFGTGADTLRVSGTAQISSAIHDADGDLSIQADGGDLEILNTATATIREARFGDGSRLIFQVDQAPSGAPLLDVTDTATFQAGSRVTASLSNLIGDGASYIVLRASTLVIDEALTELENTDAPYLYSSTLSRDPNDTNTLVLTMRRRTASELGMHDNQGAAYNAAFQTWEDNSALGAAFARLTTAADFFSAYDQLLPEYSASAIQFAIASNDSAIGALSNRLDAARRSPDQTGGIWVQEFGYFADRAANAFGPGYRGQGVGVAAGIDRPAGPFYSVGLNLVGAASEIAESNGVDEPMTALTAQFGGYGGFEAGGFTGDFYAGAGIDRFESERRVLIGTFDQTATAEWTGYHYAASARFGRDLEMGRWYARPAISVDYLRLFESSYEETGGGVGIDLLVDDRETQTFSSTASFTIGAVYGDSDAWWSPQFRIGYRNELGGVDSETTARFVGYNNPFTFQAEDLPGSGVILGFAMQAGSDYSTFSFDYDADLREGFVRHTARLVLRLVF